MGPVSFDLSPPTWRRPRRSSPPWEPSTGSLKSSPSGSRIAPAPLPRSWKSSRKSISTLTTPTPRRQRTRARLSASSTPPIPSGHSRSWARPRATAPRKRAAVGLCTHADRLGPQPDGITPARKEVSLSSLRRLRVSLESLTYMRFFRAGLIRPAAAVRDNDSRFRIPDIRTARVLLFWNLESPSWNSNLSPSSRLRALIRGQEQESPGRAQEEPPEADASQRPHAQLREPGEGLGGDGCHRACPAQGRSLTTSHDRRRGRGSDRTRRQ